MKITEKAAYIKGLAEGLELDPKDKLTKVVKSLIDLVQEMSETITELAAGDSFAILAKYTYHGNWWYIECTAGGKTARGFIDRESSALYPGGNDAGILSAPVTLQDLGTPGISPLGTEQAGELVVNGREGDERKLVHKEPDSEGKWVSVVYPARHYPYYGTKDAKRSTWYYVFVEEDSAWGWVRSTFCTPVN